MGAKVKQLAKWWAGITKNNLKSLVNMAHTFSKNAQEYRDKMAQRTKISIDKYWLTPEAVLPYDMIDKLYNHPEVTTWDTNLPKTWWTNWWTVSTDWWYNIASSWSDFK
jgi:hypothetical protein